MTGYWEYKIIHWRLKLLFNGPGHAWNDSLTRISTRINGISYIWDIRRLHSIQTGGYTYRNLWSKSRPYQQIKSPLDNCSKKLTMYHAALAKLSQICWRNRFFLPVWHLWGHLWTIASSFGLPSMRNMPYWSKSNWGLLTLFRRWR